MYFCSDVLHLEKLCTCAVIPDLHDLWGKQMDYVTITDNNIGSILTRCVRNYLIDCHFTLFDSVQNLIMSSCDRDHIGATIADDVRQSFRINIAMASSTCWARVTFPSTFDIIGWQHVRSCPMNKSPIAEPPRFFKRSACFFRQCWCRQKVTLLWSAAD